MKWKDFPEHQWLLSMSNQKIENYFYNKMMDRKILYPNELNEVYKKNDKMWFITCDWDKEKNMYVIIGTTYSNKQTIGFSFMSRFQGNQM